MKKNEHLHKYKRIDIGSRQPYIVLKCTKPSCSHYIKATLAEGKMAECPRCDAPFLLDKEALRLAVPHCSNCTVKREGSDGESEPNTLPANS